MSVPHAQIKASKSNLKDIKVEKIILEAATLKSENLFDNIQNFLENPSRGQYQTAMDCHKKSGMTLSELEDKLKQINEKLGITNEHDQEKTIQKL